MRAFYTTANECLELEPDNFSKEEIQHEWVESNLGTLFPNLELVEHKPSIASKIPDTVAYDRAANTFVAIEYKNKRSDTVREQAEDYFNRMRENRDTLVVMYNERPTTTDHRTRNSFDWNKMYVVIIAPEFTRRQVSVAKEREAECLYELKRFENGLVVLQFAGGKHGPIDAIEQPKRGTRDRRESKDSNTTGSTRAGTYETKNPFYAVVRDGILSRFPGMQESPTESYVTFKRDGEYSFCVAEVRRRRIAVIYGRKGDLSEDSFIEDFSNIGRHRGHYRSFVSTKEHLERLLSILAKVDGLSKGRR